MSVVVQAATDWPGWIAASAAVMSSIFVGTALLVAWKQVKAAKDQVTAATDALTETSKANRLQGMIQVLQLVTQDADAFQSRQWVFAHEGYLSWISKNHRLHRLTAEERLHIENVCRAWDRVGWLINHGVLDEEPVLDLWSSSIQRLYKALETYILYRRSPPNSDTFAHNFTSLYTRACQNTNGDSLKVPPASL